MLPRRCRPGLLALCALALATLVPLSPAPGAAATAPAPAVVAADPGLESQFVNRINGLRSSKGLSQLQVSGDLVSVARRWTDRMVGAGQISHNPSLGSEVGGSWTKLGENVGVGYDVDGLMQAFMSSPAHYSNLVDGAWTHVGVGVSFAGDGRLYTTHNFMALSGQPPPPPPPPAPTPPPAPRPNAPTPTGPATPTSAGPSPTTTAPPPTATTAPPPPQEPKPTSERVTAVLDPLRSLESG